MEALTDEGAVVEAPPGLGLAGGWNVAVRRRKFRGMRIKESNIVAGAVTNCLSQCMCCSHATVGGEEGWEGVVASSTACDGMVGAVERDAQEIEMGFEVCDVKRALASVARICSKGNRVVFDGEDDREGSYIENKTIGNRIKMRRKGNAWVVDVNMVGTGQAAEIWVDSAAEESVCPQDFGMEFGMTKAETAVMLVNASGGKI